VVKPAGADRERIEIVLADDHAMVRRGLRMVLDAEDGLRVVAEAGDVESALHRTRELRPQVVVLDLNMPGTPTLCAIERFLVLAPTSGPRSPRGRKRTCSRRPRPGSATSSMW
jgi:CheY-like chemotaxis protein